MDFLYYIPGLIIGLVLFIIPLWAYKKGIETGLSITKTNMIHRLVKTPKIVENFLNRQDKKESEAFNRAFNNIMSYVGEPQKESEKE